MLRALTDHWPGAGFITGPLSALADLTSNGDDPYVEEDPETEYFDYDEHAVE